MPIVRNTQEASRAIVLYSKAYCDIVSTGMLDCVGDALLSNAEHLVCH